MKFSLWTDYGALNSKPVFSAFERSLVDNGHIVVHNSNDCDVNVIWSVLWNGRMARNKNIWETQKPTIVLEVGGIKRGTTWKVALNGINRDAQFGTMGHGPERAKQLGLELKPWRTDGKFILLCGQHDKSEQWSNMPPMSKWIMDTIETVQANSDKPILFRPHPRCQLPAIESQYKNVQRQDPVYVNGSYDDFDMNFNNIFATISWSSNPAMHSVIQGIPTFTGPSSLAYDVSLQDFTQIDDPLYPDRTQWLNDYAWTEFTIEEISQGIPLKRLTSLL